MKMGAFVLKDGLAQELWKKEAPYRYRISANRRWDYRIKLYPMPLKEMHCIYFVKNWG